MVLEVLADVGSVELARQADGFEFLLRPDAGQHEDLGRTDRSCAEDHLLVGPGDDGLAVGRPVLDPGRSQLAGSVLQDHSGDLRPADHLDVRPLLDLPLEERVVRARPFAGAGRGLQ